MKFIVSTHEHMVCGVHEDLAKSDTYHTINAKHLIIGGSYSSVKVPVQQGLEQNTASP